MNRSIIRLAHALPPLPYSMEALSPYISAETLSYHHGKHHAAYVNKLNQLIQGKPELEKKSLENLIKTQEGVIFNQAAQIWNHSFYWNCMKPDGGGEPYGLVKSKILDSFGSVESFREKFSTTAAGHFGSGWAWLVLNKAGKLEIIGGHDATNPMKDGTGTSILTCDVWEHAYYVDYRNDRPKYIESWWKLINWDFANENLEASG
ncbi:superoxide dismutase SOD2 [Cardiosporidium cionae]|uniref:Superoxide dismutase n=1 Tax=Cardiosporidium cionae TaxID=476202 RepID=A0ABQ7JFJ7_9APIC|nr:superoxide dismutase SOD2 [Cardiosporidium cionae]|eukprot:KAF8822759.1 superoxide dismutase SOD2 [Cardiosporidium cionae]